MSHTPHPIEIKEIFNHLLARATIKQKIINRRRLIGEYVKRANRFLTNEQITTENYAPIN